MMGALLFVSVTLVLVGGMSAWLLTRMQTDANAVAQAQLRSATNVYAEQVASDSNVNGVTSIHVGDHQDFPSMNATVKITDWKNVDTAQGTWQLELTATATKGLPRTTVTQVTLASAGVALYGGKDANGRPVWTGARTAPGTPAAQVIPPLALRVVKPAS
jgi:hypothetical protein